MSIYSLAPPSILCWSILIGQFTTLNSVKCEAWSSTDFKAAFIALKLALDGRRVLSGRWSRWSSSCRERLTEVITSLETGGIKVFIVLLNTLPEVVHSQPGTDLPWLGSQHANLPAGVCSISPQLSTYLHLSLQQKG